MAEIADYEKVPHDERVFWEPELETIRYELTRFHARMYFSPEVIEAIRMKAWRHEVTHQLITELVGIVAMWREERMLKVPANWWQHFKQRWFPKWALRRWPVLYEYHDAAVILPKVPVVKPEYHVPEFAVWQRSEDG